MNFLSNLFSEFFTGAPEDAELILEYSAIGNIAGIRQIVRWYPDQVWRQRDLAGNSPLAIALQNNQIETALYIIRSGSPVHFDNLKVALENEWIDVVRAMIIKEEGGEYKPIVDIESNETALVRAIRLECVEVADIIIDHCDIDHLNKMATSGETALSVSVKKALNQIAIKILSREGVKLNRAGPKGWTALHWAANKGNSDLVDALLKSSADPNVTLFNGKTPLHLAAENGHYKVIRKILQKSKIDIIVLCRDSDGNLPHHYLLKKLDNKEYCEELNKPSEENQNDETLFANFLYCFKLLLEAELKDNKTCKSLHAKNKNQESVIQLISKNKALVELTDPFIQKITKNEEELCGIQICSDLHIEFGHPQDPLVKPKAKYLALLGDIGVVVKNDYKQFLLKMAKKFDKIFVIAGNHEFYTAVYKDAIDKIQEICNQNENLIFMNKTSYLIKESNVRILGTTLWSLVEVDIEKTVEMRLNDYSRIMINYDDDDGIDARLIKVADTNRWHHEEVEWLKEEINKAKENKEKIVILTHHAPIFHFGCSNAEYWDNPINHAFSTDLRSMMCEDISLWAYGHTHWFHDMTFNGTRVVSNPHGYPNLHKAKEYVAEEDPNNPYDPSFVVEV